jgi:hypothetical protein
VSHQGSDVDPGIGGIGATRTTPTVASEGFRIGKQKFFSELTSHFFNEIFPHRYIPEETTILSMSRLEKSPTQLIPGAMKIKLQKSKVVIDH